MRFIVVLTASLRYIIHMVNTIQFTQLTSTIQWFLLCSQIGATIATILEHFHLPQKEIM